MNPLVSATAKAFELLEIAYYGKLGLTNEGNYKAGLDDFVEGKKIGAAFLKGRRIASQVEAGKRRIGAAFARAV